MQFIIAIKKCWISNTFINGDHRSSCPLKQCRNLPLKKHLLASIQKASGEFLDRDLSFFIKDCVTIRWRSIVSDDRQMSNLLRSYIQAFVPLIIFPRSFFFSFLLPRRPRRAVPTATDDLYLRSRNSFSGLGASSCHVSHGSGVTQVAYIRTCKKLTAIKCSLRISQFPLRRTTKGNSTGMFIFFYRATSLVHEQIYIYFAWTDRRGINNE